LRYEPDLEWEFIDGSIVKAHKHNTGARTENDEGIGKSVAGNITKIDMAIDSYGLPIDFYITFSEVDDSKAKAAHLCCSGINFTALIGCQSRSSFNHRSGCSFLFY
jgi:hypothetical protein